MYSIIDLYFRLGQQKKAMYILEKVYEHTTDDLNYYARFDFEKKKLLKDVILRNIGIVQGLQGMAKNYGQTDFVKKVNLDLMSYSQSFDNLK